MHVLLALGENFDGMKVGVVLFHGDSDDTGLHILLNPFATVLELVLLKASESQFLSK